MYLSRRRTFLKRFFARKEKPEATSAPQDNIEKRTKETADSQSELVPDIYTQPDPRLKLTRKVQWASYFKQYQAKSYLNYPSAIEEFMPSTRHKYLFSILDPTSRGWVWNRPERMHQYFLKDKIIYQFRGPQDVKNWYCTSDHMFNGHSWCELTNSKNGKTINFRGYMSTELPRDRRPLPGPMGYKNFCYMQTKPWNDTEMGYLDWEQFTNLKIRFRGDGRKYHLCFHSDYANIDACPDMYMAMIQTNGGPQWQTISIPFSKFMVHNEFYLDMCQEKYVASKSHPAGPLHTVDYIRVMLYDTEPGPFSFEIDYIAVEKDKKEQLMLGYDGKMHNREFTESTLDPNNMHYSLKTGHGRFADSNFVVKENVPRDAYYQPRTKDM